MVSVKSVDKMSHRAMNDVSPEPFALEDYVWMNWDASESVCVCVCANVHHNQLNQVERCCVSFSFSFGTLNNPPSTHIFRRGGIHVYIKVCRKLHLQLKIGRKVRR